eukprot:2075745-Rhodomonas_salina.1
MCRPGTDPGYCAPGMLQCPVLTYGIVLYQCCTASRQTRRPPTNAPRALKPWYVLRLAYAHATRFPVLAAYAAICLCVCHAMSGIARAYAALPAYARATKCPVLT